MGWRRVKRVVLGPVVIVPDAARDVRRWRADRKREKHAGRQLSFLRDDGGESCASER